MARPGQVPSTGSLLLPASYLGPAAMGQMPRSVGVRAGPDPLPHRIKCQASLQMTQQAGCILGWQGPNASKRRVVT